MSIESEVMRSLNVHDIIHEFKYLNITISNSYLELNVDIVFKKIRLRYSYQHFRYKNV